METTFTLQKSFIQIGQKGGIHGLSILMEKLHLRYRADQRTLDGLLTLKKWGAANQLRSNGIDMTVDT